MSAHTPGPWVVHKNQRTAVYSAADSCQVRVAQTVTDWDDAGTDEEAANAARIVACVNACEGMADPAREIAALRRFAARAALAKLDGGK